LLKGIAFISLEKHLLAYPKVRVEVLVASNQARAWLACNDLDGLSFTLNEG